MDLGLEYLHFGANGSGTFPQPLERPYNQYPGRGIAKRGGGIYIIGRGVVKAGMAGHFRDATESLLISWLSGQQVGSESRILSPNRKHRLVLH